MRVNLWTWEKGSNITITITSNSNYNRRSRKTTSIEHLIAMRFRYAVEVKDRSWFQDLAYNFFASNNICMVWSQSAGIRTPPIVTTDFLYIRFIGDRSIEAKDFGRI